MKKVKVNRNILWTETFVNELSELGVKYACISPGSRNTPLTLAFANNKKIKTFINIDERSNGFFALGLAKASETPVVLTCTSGTATAEFYPAIIEAYQQRVPLIICTADRPPELRDLGANQTINQDNIYKNHIRWFLDVGLPQPNSTKITQLKKAAHHAIWESTVNSKGPVHLNFPFRKPFEPHSYTDEVNEKVIETAAKTLEIKSQKRIEKKDKQSEKWLQNIFDIVKNEEKGLIIAGPDNYDPVFLNKCQNLSKALGYPILADGASQLRFGKNGNKNLIANFDGFLRSKSFTEKYQPNVILQFGRTITSKALDMYLEKIESKRFMINEFGDWFDPANKSIASLAYKPYVFCDEIIKKLKDEGISRKVNGWNSAFLNADKIATEVKSKVVEKAKFPTESRVITELLELIPDNSQLMLSNSMPVRDFDYFASKNQKNIIVHNNRGASGIDGIISTALGTMAANNKPTVLLTGDLAFYYDLNGLLASKKYDFPLIVILINNNGGGIFEVLPISDYGKVFKDYFIVSHNLDFSHFVKGYGGNYKLIRSWSGLKTAFNKALESKNFSVLEIKTNAVESLSVRKKFWEEIGKRINNS